MKLYSYFRSSASWRVRIALHYKGLGFDTCPVNLIKEGGEHRAELYRTKNPFEQVPTLELEVEGVPRRLSQSLAIIELLEELHPDPPLFPDDPFLRARARQMAEMVNSGIQPLQNIGVMQHVAQALHGDANAFAAHFVDRGLRALESVANETAGQFLVGDAVSIADVCLVPQMFGARRFGMDLAAIPTLVRVESACLTLAAFKAAAPERQPDAS